MRMGSMDAWSDVARATECTIEWTMVRKYTFVSERKKDAQRVDVSCILDVLQKNSCVASGRVKQRGPTLRQSRR